MFRPLIISLIFGALIGLSTALYSYGLEQIQIFHETQNLYPLGLILAFGFIFLVKRQTLFFPTQVSQVVSASEVEQRHWSPFSYLWNILGSWFSHLAGASLGREGTVLVLASSLAQLCRLNWSYYRAIVISAAFACVIGQPFIALIFIIEIFKSNIDQKVFAVLMAWVGFLVMKSLGVEPLLKLIAVDLSAAFTDKLLVVVMIGLIIGLMTKYFKVGYFYLSDFFKKYKWAAVFTIALLSWAFMQPESKFLHSLSLETFSEIQNGKSDIQFVFLKTLATLLFISLGFIGGDFVPAIAIGSGAGVIIAHYFQVHFTFGLAMGLMAFFTGLTRLKWTCLWILFLLGGFKVMLWGYLCLSITRQFSGPESLYKKY
jgi:H+/Cl- antiporter ClcA